MTKTAVSIALPLFVVLALSVFTLPARADQKLTLIQGNLGEDGAFIKQYVTQQLQGYTHKYEPWKVYVGKADISRDGKPELFVFIGDTVWCGSVGCATHVFQKVSGKWAYFTELKVLRLSTDSHSEASLFLKDDGGPYLTMYSHYYGLRWSDKHNDYEQICMRPCPDG